MSTVVVAVVPGAAVGPAAIAAAVRARGLRPVFVAVAGALGAPERAAYEGFGPVVECEPDAPEPALALLRPHRPCGITTFSEPLVPLTARLGDGLGLLFHEAETVTLLTDKRAQRGRLARAGVDAVRSIPVTSREEALAAVRELAGPVVVKPVHSHSSRDTHLVADAEGYPAELTPTAERPFVVEEYLRGRDEGDFGDYVSVESLVADDAVHTLGVTGKFPLLDPFREQGQFFPSQLSPAESGEVARLATEAARALGIRRGLVHTEIKLTARGPRIIEVNGRLGAFIADLHRRTTGLDLLELGIAVACGQPVEPSAPAPGDVAFQYWNLPPLAGGALRRVDGVREAEREPGLVDYVTRVPVGSELEPSVMTMRLDFLRGGAADHAAMLRALDRCLAPLRFTFGQPDGTARTWQASRGGLCSPA
ncbi:MULTISPECIES: ATP-grasp domain-containing protein [Streptomycetaceae]|uniref:ATP-grasp domain-containing protein n=1 Tax=Streptomycetaceae TaxID=2062 RepID=UPI00093CBD52|nr:ATP-grasp domain-containing protein [Streptomyces sp. CB02056]OKI05908.1 DabC [Streptomyces sp. CB02056]